MSEDKTLKEQKKIERQLKRESLNLRVPEDISKFAKFADYAYTFTTNNQDDSFIGPEWHLDNTLTSMLNVNNEGFVMVNDIAGIVVYSLKGTNVLYVYDLIHDSKIALWDNAPVDVQRYETVLYEIINKYKKGGSGKKIKYDIYLSSHSLGASKQYLLLNKISPDGEFYASYLKGVYFYNIGKQPIPPKNKDKLTLRDVEELGYTMQQYYESSVSDIYKLDICIKDPKLCEKLKNIVKLVRIKGDLVSRGSYYDNSQQISTIIDVPSAYYFSLKHSVGEFINEFREQGAEEIQATRDIEFMNKEELYEHYMTLTFRKQDSQRQIDDEKTNQFKNMELIKREQNIIDSINIELQKTAQLIMSKQNTYLKEKDIKELDELKQMIDGKYKEKISDIVEQMKTVKKDSQAYDELVRESNYVQKKYATDRSYFLTEDPIKEKRYKTLTNILKEEETEYAGLTGKKNREYIADSILQKKGGITPKFNPFKDKQMSLKEQGALTPEQLEALGRIEQNKIASLERERLRKIQEQNKLAGIKTFNENIKPSTEITQQFITNENMINSIQYKNSFGNAKPNEFLSKDEFNFSLGKENIFNKYIKFLPENKQNLLKNNHIKEMKHQKQGKYTLWGGQDGIQQKDINNLKLQLKTINRDDLILQIENEEKQILQNDIKTTIDGNILNIGSSQMSKDQISKDLSNVEVLPGITQKYQLSSMVPLVQLGTKTEPPVFTNQDQIDLINKGDPETQQKILATTNSENAGIKKNIMNPNNIMSDSYAGKRFEDLGRVSRKPTIKKEIISRTGKTGAGETLAREEEVKTVTKASMELTDKIPVKFDKTPQTAVKKLGKNMPKTQLKPQEPTKKLIKKEVKPKKLSPPKEQIDKTFKEPKEAKNMKRLTAPQKLIVPKAEKETFQVKNNNVQ
jgi:hypothetical protein